MKTNEQNNKIAQIFANLMIERIESLKDEKWEKPWFCPQKRNRFFPKNIKGNLYQGGNSFLLTFFALAKNYQTPIFLTFKQAQERNISILKGEKSTPIYFKNFVAYKKDNGNIKLTLDEYKTLTDEEKKLYNLVFYVKMYLVFNLEQTNFSEVHPDQWEGLVKYYNAEEECPDNDTSFNVPILDNMLQNNEWVCPIFFQKINKAYFAPSIDEIRMPFKEMFVSGERFYSTLLHEMSHSTGTENRLNRNLNNYFGTDNYAVEELIAEFSAAFTSFKLGIFSIPQVDNAIYLSSWLKVLKESPKYIFNILDNSVKASNYILEQIGFDFDVVEDVLEVAKAE